MQAALSPRGSSRRRCGRGGRRAEAGTGQGDRRWLGRELRQARCGAMRVSAKARLGAGASAGVDARRARAFTPHQARSRGRSELAGGATGDSGLRSEDGDARLRRSGVRIRHAGDLAVRRAHAVVAAPASDAREGRRCVLQPRLGAQLSSAQKRSDAIAHPDDADDLSAGLLAAKDAGVPLVPPLPPALFVEPPVPPAPPGLPLSPQPAVMRRASVDAKG